MEWPKLTNTGVQSASILDFLSGKETEHAQPVVDSDNDVVRLRSSVKVGSCSNNIQNLSVEGEQARY